MKILSVPILFMILFTPLIICLCPQVSTAQADSLVSAAPAALPAPSDVITFASGQAIRAHSAAGRFAPLSLNPRDTAAIKLQFATTLAGTPVIIQPLDGGTVGSTDQSAAVAADGTTSFQFQVADQPGVYRVLVIAGTTVSVVQFSVPAPAAQ